MTKCCLLHMLNKVEQTKAMNEESRLLEDKREGPPQAESSPYLRKLKVHSRADRRKSLVEYVGTETTVIRFERRIMIL